ncbi:hypothetical protein BGZ99_008850 [Dissophora globulifera]|uniref:Retrotransposon gag domain-containing protein n=1 Tax=Dissophora globulifera TaxID=979702 RepID=A0A9P6R6F1_9FUNG|nr:hypothetical protein BGZ99_008850 [Dissophora globulifera]
MLNPNGEGTPKQEGLPTVAGGQPETRTEATTPIQGVEADTDYLFDITDPHTRDVINRMIHEGIANEMRRLDVERQNTALHREFDMENHVIQDLQNRFQVQSATADTIVSEATAMIRNEAVNAQRQRERSASFENTLNQDPAEVQRIINSEADTITAAQRRIVELEYSALQGERVRYSHSTPDLALLPIFGGVRNRTTVQDWLTTARMYLEASNIDPARYVSVVLPRLSMSVLDWFIKGVTDQGNSIENYSWEAFAKVLKEKYEAPAEVIERTALLELLEIYQGSSIISDYIDRFTEQVIKVVDLPDKHKASLLYRGLNEDIKLLMINLPVVGFDSTCHQLLQIEYGMLNAKRKVKDNVSSKTISSTSSSYNNKGKSTSGRSNGFEKKEPIVCTRCHLKYHRAKDCHTDTSKKCERCGLFGHDTDSCHRKASNTDAAIKK